MSAPEVFEAYCRIFLPFVLSSPDTGRNQVSEPPEANPSDVGGNLEALPEDGRTMRGHAVRPPAVLRWERLDHPFFFETGEYAVQGAWSQ